MGSWFWSPILEEAFSLFWLVSLIKFGSSESIQSYLSLLWMLFLGELMLLIQGWCTRDGEDAHGGASLCAPRLWERRGQEWEMQLGFLIVCVCAVLLCVEHWLMRPMGGTWLFPVQLEQKSPAFIGGKLTDVFLVDDNAKPVTTVVGQIEWLLYYLA